MVEIEYTSIKEEFIPIVKAKEILEKVEANTYEQKLALEHTKKFGKAKMADVNKLMKALEALEMRKLKQEQIVKLVDLMPEDIEDLRVILLHSDVPFKDDELQMVMNAIKSVK
jgi:DNA-directed RNA polymerase subunit F